MDDSVASGSDLGSGPPVLTSLRASNGQIGAHEAEQNHLLRALPIDEYERVAAHLRPARLDLKQVLVVAKEPIRDVYFVREGVTSILADEQAGGVVEVGTIGNEGFVGLPLLHGVDRLPFRVIVQVEGDAWRLDAAVFRRLVDERPAFRARLLLFAQFFTIQLGQSVACNRLHTVEERCARWLLMTHDRVRGDHFTLTHEFLAYMLGVRRAGVSVALGVLQRQGLITSSRSHVTVLDRERLEAAACDCYRITREAQLDVLGPASAAGAGSHQSA
jgi:CRP-like cAMP-binding protein